jgi:hypothetical protein
VDLYYRTYIDPAYPTQYVMIPNVKITNGTANRSAGTIDYSIQLATSAEEVSYRGHIDVRKLPSGAAVLFDQAVGDKVLIKNNAVLLLVVPQSAGSILLVVDDKQVDDRGNHRVALSTASNLDKQRMEASYENAKRDAER